MLSLKFAMQAHAKIRSTVPGSMGVASNEAREAVASSLFWIMTRVSRVSHTPRTMCVRSDDRDRS